MNVFGSTRSRIRPNYALITPDTHVVSPLVGWMNTSAIIHIAPELGARFLQYTAILAAGANSAMPHESVERFIYVLEGNVAVEVRSANKATEPTPLSPGGFGYFPAGVFHSITSSELSKLIVFEKVYRPLPGGEEPRVYFGNEEKVDGVPFMGDPSARLKTLLPVEPAFDMAVNVFTYDPGATLPQVEIHVMEHGLQMIAGMGVYRLGEDYYPVTSGDVIWMAPFCPQWFVAMGKEPARYIYYKDIHRDGLEDRR